MSGKIFTVACIILVIVVIGMVLQANNGTDIFTNFWGIVESIPTE